MIMISYNYFSQTTSGIISVIVNRAEDVIPFSGTMKHQYAASGVSVGVACIGSGM